MKLLSDQVSQREIEIVLRELDRTRNIPGDVVEFGCYVGTTSVYLAQTLRDTGKQLYLYDSFEGLPEKEPKMRALQESSSGQESYTPLKRNWFVISSKRTYQCQSLQKLGFLM